MTATPGAPDATSMRTHLCGRVDVSDVGTTVRVCGWVAKRREHGEHLAFVDLRDNLRELGLSVAQMPLVIQFNKRDLPGVRGDDELLERGVGAGGRDARGDGPRRGQRGADLFEAIDRRCRIALPDVDVGPQHNCRRVVGSARDRLIHPVRRGCHVAAASKRLGSADPNLAAAGARNLFGHAVIVRRFG